MPNYEEKEEIRSDILQDKVLLKRLLSYAIPYWKEFIVVILSVAYTALAMNYLSVLFGDCLDIVEVADATFDMLVPNIIWIVILIVSAMTISYFRGLILNRVGQKMLYNIRTTIFDHIEHLSLKEIDSMPVGKFVTRVCNDTNQLSNLFSNVVVSLVNELSNLVVALILMLISNVKLTLITLIIMPVLLLATFIFRYFSRKTHRAVSNSHSKLNSFVSENLSGIKITQLFNKEETKLNEFDALNEELRINHDKSIVVFGIFRPFIYVLMFTATIIIFYFGSHMVMEGYISVGATEAFSTGDLYAFYLLSVNLFSPIQNIAQQYNVLQSAFASGEKIFSVLDFKNSIVLKEDGIKADNFKGEIEFKNVWFRYVKDKWIIKNMSFHIKPGEVVSFVGPTGAGKTTILSLIGRYYDIEEGEILIDGINIKEYDIYSLRKNIGEMLQDVFLFSGTIKDNLTLKDESISDEEIIEASKYVNADTFIDRLENGYDEVVKERGNNYSQGERQLLSFARTILSHPKMIILDEATSNIDTETEVLIQDSLKKIQSVGTTIMVAHRLSTIQHSDCIYFIDGGEVVEYGNHQELLKKKGRYYSLYELQYK